MGKEIVGYRNVKELAKRLSRVVIRIPKSVLDLPPVIDQVVPVKLEPFTRGLYEQLKQNLVVELGPDRKITTPNQLALLTRLMQLTGGVLDNEIVGSEKLDILQELIESEPGKVVVFCHFLQDIERISQRLK